MSAADLLVVKFGGSGLATAERIVEAARAVRDHPARGKLVVVSAPGTTTDRLWETLRRSGDSLDPADMASVLSLGERLSARLLAAVLRSLGVAVVEVEPEDARWPIVTRGGSLGARLDFDASRARAIAGLRPLLDEGATVVVCGFLGTEDGHVTTMSRGGSDTTAVALGRALDAREVLLVKDVPGVFSDDPRQVPGARRLPEVTVEFLRGVARRGGRIVALEALDHLGPGPVVRIVPRGPSLLGHAGTTVVAPAPADPKGGALSF